ncbi:MAG TPA: hypothetical protein VHH90_03385 [Polyangia bacterium]|nr:hypothetical protein [Polyangia bacterium]
MFRLPGLPARPWRSRPWLRARSLVAVLAWPIVAMVACSVDDNGLGVTPKLSRDAGPVSLTGGVTGAGTGGTAPSGSGGSAGMGGDDQTGTGGTVAATGGMGGAAGASAAGGAGGDATGAGGANLTGGASGSGGAGAGAAAGTGLGGGATGGGVAGGTGAAGARGTGGSGGTATGTGGAAGRCGPFNCNGCCAGTVCVTASTARQCGTRGAACTDCGACQLCSGAGQCVIDPGSQWTIIAENARVTMQAPNGGPWDPFKGDEGGPAPDLFCEYENPANELTAATAGVTDTTVDVYSADWNTTITPTGVTVSASALMAARPAWRIWVGDEDCSNPNTCGLGQIACSYQQPIAAAALMSGGLSITNYQNCSSLNLRFTCASPAP